jgi:hypothetical protein
MAVSDQSKPVITMDTLNDQLVGNPFIDFLCYTVDSGGAAGDLCVVQDASGSPIARFPVDGPNYTGIRWLNNRFQGPKIASLSGSGGLLYVHVRK